MNSLQHSLNDSVPQIDLEESKRVKILATVGPATSSKQKIRDMFESGVNGFRLNFSHGTHSEKLESLKIIREISSETRKPVAVVQDLHGPKIALSKFEGQGIVLDEDTVWTLQFKGKVNEEARVLPLEIDLALYVEAGQPLFIADGRIKTEINEVNKIKNCVTVKVINGGVVTSGKGLNLPETNFSSLGITEKDIEDVRFGVDKGFDYVALSFVQTVEDVRYFKSLLKNLGSSAKIITKIETRTAVENLEGIIAESDGVMVARGDLATEVGPEAVPVLQRKIIGLCMQKHKFSIVATQMLASMVASPESTRAEVSDIATAVITGADCVMLSEETAIGQYPIEVIATMKRTILYTERHNNVRAIFKTPPHQQTIAEAIASTVMSLADIVRATAIVVETSTGACALHVSSHRPERTIIAVTPSFTTAQQLSIIYGIKSFVRPVEERASAKLTSWLQKGKVLNSGDVVVVASGQYPGKVGGTDTIKVRVI